MGEKVQDRTEARAVVEGRSIGGNKSQCGPKRTFGTLSRFSHRWASGSSKNLRCSHTVLLVARSPKIRTQIRQRMRNLSSKQDHHETKRAATYADLPRVWNETIPNNSDGSYCQIAQVTRARFHINNNRSRLYQGR